MYKKLGLCIVALQLLFMANAQEFEWMESAKSGTTVSTYGVETTSSGDIVMGGYFTDSVLFNGNYYFAEKTGQTSGYLAFFDSSGTFADIAILSSMDSSSSLRLQSITLDKNDNVYAAGYFSGTVQIGTETATDTVSSRSMFVAKYSSSGDYIWSKTATPDSASAQFQPMKITVDNAGNIFIVSRLSGSECSFEGTPLLLNTDRGRANFIVKMNSSGSFEWAKNLAYNGGVPETRNRPNTNALKCDSEGYIYVAGQYSDTVILGNNTTETLISNGATNHFFAKLDKTGELLWVHVAGNDMGAIESRAYFIHIDSDDNIYTGGSFQYFLTLDVSDESYMALGSGGWYSKWNGNGDMEWVQALNPVSTQDTLAEEGTINVRDLKIASNGDYVLLASYTNGVETNDGIELASTLSNYGVLSYNSQFDYNWGAAIQSSGRLGAYMAMNSGNNLIVGGTYSGNTYFTETSDSLTYTNEGTGRRAPTEVYLTKLKNELSAPVVTDIETTGLTISAGPVPCNTTLSIEVASDETATASLYSMLGQLMYTSGFSSSTTIPMETLPAGIYTLKIEIQGEVYIQIITK